MCEFPITADVCVSAAGYVYGLAAAVQLFSALALAVIPRLSLLESMLLSPDSSVFFIWDYDVACMLGCLQRRSTAR